MMGRALSLAAAGVLGCLVASPGQAQQNLDAGKSAAQIFNGNCGACHRSARGLLKTVSPSSLPEFLREHYTTGSDMAQALTAYLTSNRAGAADRDGARGGKAQERANIRPDAPIGNAVEGSEQANGKPSRAAASKPDEQGANPVDPGKRRQRRGADAPDQAAGEADPAAPEAKPRQARRGKRGEPAVTSAQPAQGAAPKPETPAPAPKDASTPKDTERAIDARVPVPEPVVLPPPTAADVKPPEAKTADKPVEAKPAETRPEAPAAAADKPATEKPAIEKPAEAAHAGTPGADVSAAPDGAPSPPISR